MATAQTATTVSSGPPLITASAKKSTSNKSSSKTTPAHKSAASLLEAVVEPSGNRVVTIVEACPECGKNDFKTNAERGRHRRAVHGVQGSSPSAKKRLRAAEAQQQQLSLPEGHQDGSIERAAPKSVTRQGKGSNHVFAVAYAAGYITAFLEGYCREAQIPVAEFTDAVIRVLHGS